MEPTARPRPSTWPTAWALESTPWPRPSAWPAARALDPVSAARLFDRFYTVETGRGSTGLGLSIARQLTERMGGTIRADYEQARLYITVHFPKT